MNKKIETLAELRNMRVHRFPTNPKQGMRVLRIGDVMVATDPQGRIYTPLVRHRGSAHVGALCLRTQAVIADALRRMGLLSDGVCAELAKEAERKQRQDDANYALSMAKDLAALGVPFTKSQLRRLRTLAR